MEIAIRSSWPEVSELREGGWGERGRMVAEVKNGSRGRKVGVRYANRTRREVTGGRFGLQRQRDERPPFSAASLSMPIEIQPTTNPLSRPSQTQFFGSATSSRPGCISTTGHVGGCQEKRAQRHQKRRLVVLATRQRVLSKLRRAWAAFSVGQALMCIIQSRVATGLLAHFQKTQHASWSAFSPPTASSVPFDE